MSVEFSGAAASHIQYASVPTSGDFTVTGWFKLVDVGATWRGMITGGNYWGIWKNGGVATGELVTLSDAEGANSIGTVTVDEWFFLALTHDDSDTGNEIDGYFREEADTALTSFTGHSAAVGATDDLYIGHSPFGEQMSGDFKCLKIWTRLLTADEILLESQMLRPFDWAGIWAFCPTWSPNDTDDGTTTGAFLDYSGNGNHAPASGTHRTIDDATGTNTPLVPYGLSTPMRSYPVAVAAPANPSRMLLLGVG